jgi:hypothetical protein
MAAKIDSSYGNLLSVDISRLGITRKIRVTTKITHLIY